MRRLPLLLAMVLLACVPLAGCSLSPLINADVVDYFEVNDLAANRILLLNILRAKDGAPLHFSELSLVRGQVSAGTSASATFPFGPLMHASSPRRLAAITGNVSSAPSFDVGSLDTQDFTKGVMSPISPATLKFFLDEGIDYRLVLLLLISGVQTPGNQEMILNAPESARQVCYDQDVHTLPPNALPDHYIIIAQGEPCATGSAEPEFFGFLRVLNHLRRVYAADYSAPPLTVGRPFAIDMRTELRALTTMDPSRYHLDRLPSGEFQIVGAERRAAVVLCEEPERGGMPVVLAAIPDKTTTPRVPADACVARNDATDNNGPIRSGPVRSGPIRNGLVNNGPVINGPVINGQVINEGGNSPSAETPHLAVITMRSTLEVIQYIGRILAFQEANLAGGGERCVTLGYEGANPGCGGNVLFHLQHNAADPVIDISYRGRDWEVPASRVCGPAAGCDHTLEAMAMVSLLLNQNKSAKDIPSTPAFQAVP